MGSHLSSSRDLRNLPLASLSDSDFEHLSAGLRPMKLVKGEMVRYDGMEAGSICFPLSGTISTIIHVEDGRSVEAAMTGFDGMIDMSALGTGVTLGDHLVQGAGEALMISVSSMRRAMQNSPGVVRMMCLSAEINNAYILQSVACRSFHPIESRLCRWLLMTRYHLRSDHLPLTQEFLALMLGAQRSTITAAAAGLQRDGLIMYHRGEITLLDVPALEQRTCQCHQRVMQRVQLAFSTRN